MWKKPFQSGKDEMSTVSDAELVLTCAEPAVPGESRKQALLRAARFSGLTYSRITAFFYGKGNPPSEAREKLIAAACVRHAWADIQMDQKLAAMTAEYERLKADVERLDREINAARRLGRDGCGKTDRRSGSEN